MSSHSDLFSRHMKQIKIAAIWLAGLLIVFMSGVIAMVYFDEWQRKELIESYQMPSHVLVKMLLLKHGPISMLMEDGETIVCTINAYSSVENILSLTDKQKDSLPKSKLPSQDRTWYFLYFTDIEISRIFLIDNDTIEGTVDDSELCVARDGYFEILEQQDLNQQHFVFRLTSKEIPK